MPENARLAKNNIGSTVGADGWWVRQCWPLVVVAILAIAIWRRFSNWPNISDIGLWDETIYLNSGLSHAFTFSAYEDGPLYSACYYALGLLIHNAREVYFVGELVLQVLLLCLICFVSWRFSRSLAVTVAVCGLVVFSRYLLDWPHVSYLAAILVLLGIWCSSLEIDITNRLAVTALFSFLLTFVRPEFVLTFYLSISALLIMLIGWTAPDVYRLIRTGNQFGGHRLRLGGYLITIAALCAAWSIPSPQGNRRAMLALGQHFALQWTKSHNSHVNPWLNYPTIMNSVFPGAKTPVGMLFANPAEWVHFIAQNALMLIPTVAGRILPRQALWISAVSAGAILCVLVIAAVLVANRMRSDRSNRVLTSSIPSIESGLYSIAPLTAMIIISPEAHYAVPLVTALMPCLLAVGRWHSWSRTKDVGMALVGAVLIALAAQPLPTVAQPNAETIATLTRLDLPMKKVLELDGGWCTYVIPRCAWINFAADPVTGDPFTADLGDFAYFDRLRRMVLDGKIDSIVVSAGLIEYLNTRGEILENLTRNSSDWKRHEIGNGRYLLFNRKYVR